MKTPPPLDIHYLEGEAIPEPLLRSLWSLRLEMLTLNRSEDDDWRSFSAWARGPDKCLFAFLDGDGAPQGFFTVAFMPLDHDGARHLLMYSKYFYFRPAYRGHYKTLLAPWRLLPLALRRYGLRRLHFVTTSYPQSYVSLSRTAGRVWSLSEPAPPQKRAALEHFALAVGRDGFDPDRGVVSSDTVADSASLPRSDEARRLFATYEQLNPRWREGWTLPILFSVDAQLVAHNLRRMTRRAVGWR